MTKLFVYGSLKKGKFNHTRYDFHKSKFLGGDKVQDFALVQKHPYPFCIEEKGCVVIGEVYEVNDEVMEGLDRMEKGAGYKRVDIITKGGVKACIYVEGHGKTYPDLERYEEF